MKDGLIKNHDRFDYFTLLAIVYTNVIFLVA